MTVIIEGAVIALAGVAVGRFLPGRRKGPKLAKQPEPICGCDHHHSFHDPKTGECHGLMDGAPVRYNEYDRPMAYEQVRCSCRQYSGPVPIPEYFAAELTDGG